MTAITLIFGKPTCKSVESLSFSQQTKLSNVMRVEHLEHMKSHRQIYPKELA